MTVEIRELTLRARVDRGGPEKDAPGYEDVCAMKQQILDECLELIRNVLRRQSER